MRPRLSVLTLAGLCTLAGLSLAATTSATSPTSLEVELLSTATLVFKRAVETPAAAIPAAVMMRASAIAVFPNVVKDGNRHYGKGVMSARGARPDAWTPPAFIALEGAIPFDLNVQPIDFIVIAQSRRGLDSLIHDGFSGSMRSPMSAGDIGHSTPVRIDTDLLAYMQFDVYFAGITIHDWSVRAMNESNAALYGQPYSTDDLVRRAGFFHVPSAARMWRDAIADYFREMS
jgi:lipid-binding SYLF domain-containing protein